ncbi:hypothetical protein J3R82DRAFT_7759 [Butyriboletus roseoflavus]|nr:hypothetical protein J3R82DRAFT_7759 [Butyriboletus roseoflavus]
MYFTPFLYGASQLHVHMSAILSNSLLYLCLIKKQSIKITFTPNFLLAKVTHDLKKCNDLFGKFNLSSLRHVNSGGEAVVSSTTVAFSRTLRNLTKNGNALFIISIGFDMTETCAGCIYDPINVLTTPPAYEFLKLGTPIAGCKVWVVNPKDSVTLHPDGQRGELQVHGPMIFCLIL